MGNPMCRGAALAFTVMVLGGPALAKDVASGQIANNGQASIMCARACVRQNLSWNGQWSCPNSRQNPPSCICGCR